MKKSYNKMIKFSIIVAVYNIEDYIQKCVKSILAQTYSNYELIIVDDGSTDNSINNINQINDCRIKILHKSNGGLSDARNFGIKHATGDYVWFVDGDDYINENALDLLNNEVSKKQYDVLIFKYYIDKKGKITKCSDCFFNNYDNKRILSTVSAWSKIYNRKFYIKNHFSFLKNRIYEDLELIPFILAKTNNLLFLDDYLYYYVIRDGSIMNSSALFKKNRDDKFFVIKRLINKFKNEEIYDNYKEELVYLTIRHLIFVTSTEIMVFGKNIYYPRCLKVLELLDDIDKKWYKNNYLKKSSFLSKLYVFLFRRKFFDICSILIRLRESR